MTPDPKNQFTYTTVIAPKAQTNNTGNGGLDLRGYIGSLAIVVGIGAKTIGDADGTITVRVTTSTTNNISNGVNYGTATVSTTNATAVLGQISVDVRDATGPYLFAVPAITGTNSPSYPLSVVAVGMKQVQPAS